MTDKELLEEIIENVEEIMETPYVARKEKAVEVGIKLIMTGKVDFLLRKIDSLEEENKCYREWLEKIERNTGGEENLMAKKALAEEELADYGD